MRNVRLHRSGKYEARVQYQGRSWSAYGNSEDEALRSLEDKLYPTLRGTYTFKQWMEEKYLPSIQRTSEAHKHKAKWAIAQIGKLSDVPLESIGRHQLQTLLDSLKFSAESMKTIRSIWFAGLNLAEADDVIQKNPMRFVRLKRTVTKRKEILTREDLLKLIEHSRGYAAHPVVILGGLMGLRIGEIRALRAEHFQDGKLIVPGTKSEASQRELPMHPKILEELQGYKFPLAPEASRSNENLKRAAFRAQMGIYPTNHLLRHSYASLLEWLGCPLDVRARMLGHGKRTVTQRYSHAEWRNWEEWGTLLVEHVYQSVGYKVG